MRDTSPPRNRRGRRMLWASAVQRRVPTASLRSPAGSTASTDTLRVTGACWPPDRRRTRSVRRPDRRRQARAGRPRSAAPAPPAAARPTPDHRTPHPRVPSRPESRVALLGRGGARRLGIVAQVGSQPALGLVHADPLALGVVLDLIAGDPPDGEVARLR